MATYQILTKDNCPKCDSLKMYITHALGEAYLKNIEWVHQTESPELFTALAEKHQVMATPVIINGDDVLFETTPLKVQEFLKEN